MALGVLLLVQDLRGRLVAPSRRVPMWRALGCVSAGAVGLVPLAILVTGRLEWDWPYPIIAFGYAGLAIALVLGALGLQGPSGSRRLRRVAYLGLLALAALPSMVLLLLTPLVALAGTGLVRPAPGGLLATDVAAA